MAVLVTGANGFLATNIIIELLRRKYTVNGLLRDKTKFQLKESSVTLYTGDLSNEEDIRNAINDGDTIIHVAANTSQYLNSYDDFNKVNVIGTKNVLAAAQQAKVKRLVYVSTANTFGFGSAEKPGNEFLPIKKPFTDSFYAFSKLEAQIFLLEYTKNNKSPEIIIVNPTFILGEYASVQGSGKAVRMAYKKKIQFVPPGGKNFVHVVDVAIGVCNAIENGRSGQAYLLSNLNMSYKDFFKMVNKATGTKSVIITIPSFILLAIGVMGSLVNLIGLKTEVTLTNMKILCVKNYYTNEKAVQELGMTFFTPISKAISDTIGWFKKEGIIK